MKKAILTLSVVGVCLAACGQGTLYLANYYGGVNAPDYLCDSSTRLSGPQYMAEMMAGQTPTNLIAVGQTYFNSWPGYYDDGYGETIPVGFCGDGFAQINIWNTNAGLTFEAARASGLTNAWAQSSILTVRAGGFCCDPPCVPFPLTGLTSLTLNGPYSPPKIGITLISAETIQLDWPYGLGNYAVEQSPNLLTNSWTLITNAPTVYYSSNLLTVAKSTNATFFRLVMQ